MSQEGCQGDRILIVDDDPTIVAIVTSALTRSGMEVVGCDSRLQMLELLGCSSSAEPVFDLALIDNQLPDGTGLDVAATLRVACIPFVFLTSSSDRETVEAATQAGALNYLVKPLDPAQIVPQIRATLARSRDMTALHKRAEHLSEAFDRTRNGNMAVGWLMCEFNLTVEEAQSVLRRHAMSQRRRLDEVAAELLGAQAIQAGFAATLDEVRRTERRGAKPNGNGRDKSSTG